MDTVRVAPSLLAADFARIGTAISTIEESGAAWIHLDIMDGHFVPNISFGSQMVAAVRAQTRLPLDVHFMVSDPRAHLDTFANAGANYITFHAEAALHSQGLVKEIQAQGKKAGVALVPATPVTALEFLLPFVDLVLVMTVNPGFGGQTLIPECLTKIGQLRQLRAEKGLSFLISVDGGITPKTAAAAREQGADVLVAGSAFFNSPDKNAFVRLLCG